jgi:hypothetical protein
MSGSSIATRLLNAFVGLLLAIAAFGLAAFAAETFFAALEGEATTPSLFAAAVALILFLWCARTSWRYVAGLARAGTPRR